MDKIQQYLTQNVGFHFEDLSLQRQLELETIQKEMKVDSDWILLALSRDSLEKWEDYGFALFRKKEFRDGVNASLRALRNIPEERIERELTKTKAKKKAEKVWDGIPIYDEFVSSGFSHFFVDGKEKWYEINEAYLDNQISFFPLREGLTKASAIDILNKLFEMKKPWEELTELEQHCVIHALVRRRRFEG